MDPSEPQWRMNSSFSPPVSRRWDCRFHADGLPCGINGGPVSGSSGSSHSKGSRRRVSSEPHPNHHHSVSDGALSYFESPPENLQATRWTQPLPRYDLGEFSTPAGGAKPESYVLSQRHFTAGVPSMSSSLGSASPASESSRWASTSKQPIFLPPRNFSGRRSFMSKPVYPLIFRNPVSDPRGMAGPSIRRMMSGDNNRASSPMWPGSTFSPDLKFHKTLTNLQKEASPDLSTSSRREGFRWSNASSYDFGFDGDAMDITEHIGLENLKSPSENLAKYQKCGLCERPLWQKSPWSSRRIVRSTDMPVTGVLPCCHVFHAECLEETTPKSQIREPPCPLCSKAVGSEGSISFSEPLQVALRSVRRSQGANNATSRAGSSSSSGLNPDQTESDLRRNQSLPRRGLKGHFKKRFSLKGRTGKDLFSAKIFGRTASSSSSSSMLHDSQSLSGRLRFRPSSK